MELCLSILVLLFLVEDATLSDNCLTGVRWHLRDKTLRVRHFLKFVLDMHLELQYFVSVVGMIDLLCHLGSFLVHASLEEALSVV